MPWPLSQDYNEAIQTPSVSFSDSDLRQGQARTNALGLPVPCSGNFADVYQVGHGARAWAVKCFTRESPGLRERYFEISAYLQKLRLPFMVDFRYLDQGIHARGQWYPVLKMDWVEGFTLNQFIKQNLDRPRILQKLAHLWLELARRLREANLAHCDLQHGNVLLVPRSKAGSLAIKLVDYDGMFVPALAGQPSDEVGHSAYQHPQRLREGTYNREVDRFPFLVIFCAIRGLIVGGRALWERYDNGDNLLFREQDLRSPRDSALFWELARLADPDVPRLADIPSRAVYKPIEKTPLLEDLLLNGPELLSVTAGTPKSLGTTTPAISAEVVWATAPPPVTEPICEAVTSPEETARSVFDEAIARSVFAEAMPSDMGKLWKERGHGALVNALIGTLCIFLCCLGVGTLIMRSRGDKTAASSSVAKSENRLKTPQDIAPDHKKPRPGVPTRPSQKA